MVKKLHALLGLALSLALLGKQVYSHSAFEDEADVKPSATTEDEQGTQAAGQDAEGFEHLD